MKPLILFISFYLLFPFEKQLAAKPLLQKDTINFTDSKGLKQGRWIVKYNNGKTRYERQFRDNNPVDTFIYYNESGEKNAEMIFSEKGKKSKAKYFHTNGTIKGKGNYIDQKKDSTWLYYDDREIISEEENYIDGKKEGISKAFYLDGSIAEEKSWKNNLEHGPYKEFFKGGKIKFDAIYVDGNPDGKVSFYHPNGQLRSSGIYKYAVKEGEWITYNEDGTIYTREIFNKGVAVRTEKLNGVFISNYPSGNLMGEVSYKNGVKNGPFTEFYDKAPLLRQPKDTTAKALEEWETIYSDDKIFQDQQVIEAPKVKRKGSYLNGKLDGEVEYYNSSSELEKIEHYRDGIAAPQPKGKQKK